MVSIDRPLKTLHFRNDPGPLNRKNRFGRLNNSPCKLIESSTQRCKKNNRGWFSVQIVSITERCKLQSPFMSGGLFQSRIYLRVLSGIGIDSCENLTSFPPAIWVKKCAKRKSTFENPRKFNEKSR
jgi:hypothetical protein